MTAVVLGGLSAWGGDSLGAIDVHLTEDAAP